MAKKVNRQKRQQILHEYLQEKVQPVFDRLITELLASMPDDIITWSVNWLNDKGKKLFNASRKNLLLPKQADSGSEDDDEEIEDLPKEGSKKQQAKASRVAVSAEVYGAYNKKEDFKPRVIQKTNEQIERINKRLSTSFMFSALDDNEKNVVIGAMEEKLFKPGEWVIKQGEDGNELYVIDSGELDCFKQFKKGEEAVFLKSFKPGDSFGELALLYNAPRAASIQVTAESILFALDRATFNNIVKDAAIRKREKFETILKNIELLSSMDPYERTQLNDGAKEIKFKAGEVVIKQGEPGDTFYMISEGELVATRVEEGQTEHTQSYYYKAGDYFGEVALLKNVPRQATIIAKVQNLNHYFNPKTDVSLVYLDYGSFKRLMGPIEEILKRNVDRYSKFVGQLQQ